MADHHDFNPNGPRPPRIPRFAKRWDFSGIWRHSAHLRFYDFYGRARAWVWADGSSAEWAFLGGAFLTDIQGQSQVLQEERRVRNRARALAQSLCAHLREGETNTFADRGYALVRADVGSTNVALSLGRFSLYWRLDGSIGPKRRMADGSYRATWRASITWTLYDYYDFAPYVIVGSIPELLGFGHPFHMTATWTSAAGGIVTCRTAPAPEAPGHAHEEPPAAEYRIVGAIVIVNDCDGRAQSIPDAVSVVSALLDSEGNAVAGETTGLLTPDLNDPDNPRKIGSYTIGVVWPAGHGPPARWRMPKITRPDGSDVCGQIACEGGRCLDMATRERFVPFSAPTTVRDLRVFCTCLPR